MSCSKTRLARARCTFILAALSVFQQSADRGTTKTRFVCATSKQTNDAVCLTSYRTPRSIDLLNTAKVWQACRATSAATTFFDPIAIGIPPEEFVDGALGMNNPIFALWNQA